MEDKMWCEPIALDDINDFLSHKRHSVFLLFNEFSEEERTETIRVIEYKLKMRIPIHRMNLEKDAVELSRDGLNNLYANIRSEYSVKRKHLWSQNYSFRYLAVEIKTKAEEL